MGDKKIWEPGKSGCGGGGKMDLHKKLKRSGKGRQSGEKEEMGEKKKRMVSELRGVKTLEDQKKENKRPAQWCLGTMVGRQNLCPEHREK